MSTEKGSEDEVFALLNALAESVWDLSEDEVDAELARAGEDPARVAEAVDDVVLDAVARHRRTHLRDVRSHYDEAIREDTRDQFSLPDSEEAQRLLLAQTLAAQPAFHGALTMHHRDLQELSAEDVASALRQLAQLGVFHADD